MAVQAPQAKQRFLSLEVDEVSLVDAPANSQPFVVKKSLNPEETVSTQTTQTQPDRNAQITEALGEVDVVKSVITTLTILKDLKDGKAPAANGDKQYDEQGMMKKLAGLCAEKSMPPGLKAKLEKLISKGGNPFAKKPADEEKKPPAEAKSAKKEDEETEKGKAKKGDKVDEKVEPPVDTAKATVDTAKSVGDGVGDPQVELVHQLLMAAVSSIQKASMLVDMELSDLDGAAVEKSHTVEKGLKQFSAERVSQLKAAAKQMVDLLKELSPAHLKDLGMGVEDAASAKEPSNGADGAGKNVPPIVAATTTPSKNPPVEPAGPAQGQASPLDATSVAQAVQKAVTDAVTEAVKPLTVKLEETQKANVALQGKIAELEKVRGVSKSLPDDSTEQPTKKSTSLFAGVL